MKRIISLIIALAFVVASLTAQTTTQTSEEDYRTQTGTMLVSADQHDFQIQMDYKLHPQPAISYLGIQLSTESPILPTVYLASTDGEELPFKVTADASDTNHILRMNVKDLPEGMYFLIVSVPGVGETEGMPIIKLDALPVLMQ